jgi:uncharacterized protein YprB with RNaseH-like and TPR domain
VAYNDELAEPICIDLESVASPNAESMLDPIRAPSSWRDPFKILTYQQEKLAERIATAGLEPDLCEIVALGMQHVGGDPEVRTRQDHDEAAMLEWFWESVGPRRFVGHNILQFDIPVLIRRSQLLGVKHPVVNIDRYRTPHIDTLQRLSFNGAITLRSLGFYARIFGVSSDDTVKGSDIPQLVVDGNWQAIHDHCKSDIATTSALAAKLGWWPNGC